MDVGVDGEGALAGSKGAVGGSLGLGDGHDGGGLNQLLAGLGSATAELGVDSEGADGRSRQGEKEGLDNVDLHDDGRLGELLQLLMKYRYNLICGTARDDNAGDDWGW